MKENKEHYDALYRNADVSSMSRKVLNPLEFLRDATRTDTSWVGLYYGDFVNRVKGSKILELGAGNGLNALIMAALGASVVAMDISEESPIVMNEASRVLGL